MNTEILKIELNDFGNLFRSDPTKLSDQEILSLDFILHRAWKVKREGGRIHLGEKSWSFEDLINLHALVRQEMSKRTFQHRLADELDQQTQPFLKSEEELAPVYPSGIELGREITLKEVLPQIKSFYAHPIFAWIVGGLANWGKTKGDIDVLWWAGPEIPDYLKKILEIRFGRQFADQEIAGRVQHHLNYFQGPFTKAVSIYALKVERVNPEGEVKEAGVEIKEVGFKPDHIDLVWDELHKGWTIPDSWADGPTEAAPKPILEENEITENSEAIDKGVRQAFGSYGGKRFLAHRIASYVPHHKTYVEPFAGGAAVFFAKDPSPHEVLNDRDSEIAFMYRFIRDHALDDRHALEKRDWIIHKGTHERLKGMKPASDRDRFYKAFYLTRSSYGKQRGGSFNPANAGVRIDFPANVERAQVRLQNVVIQNKDYLETLKEHDHPETFFYMDPPYPGKYNLFDFGFKEEKFIKALKGLKAKWIVSYPSERASVFKGYHVYRVKRRNQMKGPGGNQEWVTELMVSNFPLKSLHLYVDKELEPDPHGMESEAPHLLPHLDYDDELEKVQAAFKSPGGKYRLYKKIIRLIPEHKTFVEAFCGGAQVFFHKKRSEEEVMNDVNSDIIFAYRFIKGMAPDDWEWLKKQNWMISKARAKKIFEMKPTTIRERFYRFAYLNKSLYWGRTDVWEGVRTGEKGEGYRIKLARRLPEIQERLKGVKLHSWDWREVIKEYDSKETFFYLDPPYPLHWPREGGGHGSKFFKEEDLLPVLRNIKGKFILSYELEKLNIFKGFKTYRVKTLWTGMHQMGARSKFELLVSNFPIKPNDLYMEKLLEPIIKQDEIYNVNPHEDETYRYVIQHHWRGRTVHADLRMESIEKDFLIGWTLADLVEGKVKEPVETLEAAKEWSKDGSAFKIDFSTGRFKEHRKQDGSTTVPSQIRAFPKAKQPHVWLEVEGNTDPYPAPGSTRNFPGVLLIEDKGVCEYGAQKPDVHEYFLHGKIEGRLLIRRLPHESLKKVLPPTNIDESPVTDIDLWVAIQPKDQTPIVLTEREVELKWLPPFGISALPKVVRRMIPPEFQYWKIEDRKKALKMRNTLIQAIKDGRVQTTKKEGSGEEVDDHGQIYASTPQIQGR